MGGGYSAMVQARGSIPLGGTIMNIHFYSTEKSRVYDFEIIDGGGITYGTIVTHYHPSEDVANIDYSSHEYQPSEDEIVQAFHDDQLETREQNKHDIYDQFNDR